jgi:hypothetical protein
MLNKLIKFECIIRRPRRRFVDNSKIDLGEIKWDSIYWSDLAMDRD